MTELSAGKKEAGPVVVLAKVGPGRNGHDLARTFLYNDSHSPRAWSPSCRIRHASILQFSSVQMLWRGGGGPPPDLL